VFGAVDAASTFTIGNEGEVAIQNATAMPNAITITGGTNSVLSFENGGTGEAAGPVTLNASAIIGLRDWYNYATVRSGIISGQVTGAGGLTVNSGTGNGGLLTLSNAANSYAGGTTLNASRVLATSSSALGTGAVTIGGTNARLELGNGVNIANPITINAGAGTAAMGVIWVPVLNESATVSGAITINGAPGGGGHLAANGGTLNVTGPITSSVPVTVRLGTVVLSNTTSSYAGMQVISGTAKVGATNAIPVAVAPILGSGGVTGTLDLGGFNQTLAGVTQSVAANAGSIITNSGGSDSTLTTTGTSTYVGVITNGPTNKVALNVASGALTLGGVNNTFTGNITVSGGLTLADNAQLRFTPGPNTLVNSIGGNGTVNLDGDFVIETAGATVANGNSWTLVNVGTLTETFGATFSVVGFTESANVWTKVEGTNTWTFSEATGVLTLSVGAASAYNSWATTMGLDGTNNGPTQDNGDFDGVSNALEFVLGGNPKISDPLILPDPTVTATDFIFTFKRADESESEIGLTFQYGSTLTGWTDVAIGATTAASGSGVVVTEDAPSATVDTVVVTVPKTSAVGGKLFGRLRAVK
jgi:autotransporter-associated beta strand protein